MVNYEAAVIQKFAEMLYSRARSIVVVYTVLGIIVGAVGAGALVRGLGIASVVGAALCGILGYFVGQGRAFTLRLTAQQALCQIEIEKNTRGSSAARVAA
jgi:hypothetical protein